ncbi:DNA-binding protein [Aquimonas sp.]|jgi:chromosome segregation ATPase|uniref:DNA-binding protein n=1 Tax=Aquimonas sp. TaxID=1872588 RepID=UPI0037BF7350
MSETPVNDSGTPLADGDLVFQRRIEEVRKVWLVQTAGRIKRPISVDDVREIALLLAGHGLPPSVRAIRQVFGGGSPNVITPHLRQLWLNRSLQRGLASREDGAKLPQRLLDLWDVLLEEARVAARASFSSVADQQAVTRAQLDALRQDLETREQVLGERVAGMEAEVASAKLSAQDLRGTLAERTKERDQALAEAQAQHKRVEEALAAAADARHALAVSQGELAAASAHAAAEAKKNELEAERYRQLQAQLADALKRGEGLVLERATLEIDLNTARADATASRERQVEAAQASKDVAEKLQRTEAELAAIREKLEALRADFDRRGSDLLQHQKTVATLTAEAKLREKLEVDLNRARDDLRAVIHERDNLLRTPPALIGQLQRIHETLEKLLPRTPH